MFSQSFRSTPPGVNLSLLGDDATGSVRQVDAKYPALLFKQQLTAYVEKIYGMIRDNLKKEISPQLGLCIQVFPCNLIRIFIGIQCSLCITPSGGELYSSCSFHDWYRLQEYREQI